MRKIILCMVTLMLVVTGCSKEKPKSDNYVKITPSKLFQGDTKRLEPHMNMSTGCVDVKYKGNKKIIATKYELWKNGKLITEKDSVSQSIQNNEFSGEISISLKDMIETDFKKPDSMLMKTVIRDENGFVAVADEIEKFDEDKSYGADEISEEINVSDNKPVAVWGLFANSSGKGFVVGDIDSRVKEDDWALILKVYLK